MQLPISLRNAIEQELSSVSFSVLTAAASELSDRYRKQLPVERFIASDAQRLAYLAVRMPATFAAVRKALSSLAPEFQPASLLDLGAGTGAAAWAAADAFDSLRRFTLIEQDSKLIELGRTLAQQSEQETLRTADWKLANLRGANEFPPHDVVICSYSLGEIDSASARKLINAAWQAAGQLLIVVEPGTMKGFATVHAVRDQLIEAGAFLVAPCPHQNACPMLPTQEAETDWCHFSARFDRTSLHRRLKGGSLGYEDEKFSYIIAAKHPVASAPARVIRHPLRQPGFTQLQLCTPEGLQTRSITKRDKETWKRARKTDWGDGFEMKSM